MVMPTRYIYNIYYTLIYINRPNSNLEQDIDECRHNIIRILLIVQ